MINSENEAVVISVVQSNKIYQSKLYDHDQMHLRLVVCYPLESRACKDHKDGRCGSEMGTLWTPKSTTPPREKYLTCNINTGYKLLEKVFKLHKRYSVFRLFVRYQDTGKVFNIE